MLLRRRGTVSIPSANSTAYAIINLQDKAAIAVLSYWLHIVNLLNLGDRVDDTD